jgi:hypothetical protein
MLAQFALDFEIMPGKTGSKSIIQTEEETPRAEVFGQFYERVF